MSSKHITEQLMDSVSRVVAAGCGAGWRWTEGIWWAGLIVGSVISPVFGDECLVAKGGISTEAPHGRGNLYAPEIIAFRGEHLLFFGGQGRDGHDRIHLARSQDGKKWEQSGIVFSPEDVNHVNDPSVVVVGDELYLFYTLARAGVTDSIGLAISKDGRQWHDRGVVFAPAAGAAWDSLSVGRPSVLHDGSRFRLWYDGRKDLPTGAPDPNAPKSVHSRRFVGYAESADGVEWTRREQPVFGEDAGGVQVSRQGEQFVMVIESRVGTKWAVSGDGMQWESRGILHPNHADSAHGQVTPFLWNDGPNLRLLYGAAQAETWDQNSIWSVPVDLPLARKDGDTPPGSDE